ncbi:ty3-gypsy retrotransposon protein [Cucumis melo var. makuwa]|uniref:Ty3-gypsy retrotransposon protein n=1 Tax=Cucumis melo var. makuwa TaxID=1194695 RepID=A0A5A7SMP3_CUCMM|nr:ty3-gypsy retrotransposon protein [Cucumis melo var. makuwa]TYK16851.1 ty3-gypsy retrotransposon protein [Cucumis melo var. makuwa]
MQLAVAWFVQIRRRGSFGLVQHGSFASSFGLVQHGSSARGRRSIVVVVQLRRRSPQFVKMGSAVEKRRWRWKFSAASSPSSSFLVRRRLAPIFSTVHARLCLRPHLLIFFPSSRVSRRNLTCSRRRRFIVVVEPSRHRTSLELLRSTPNLPLTPIAASDASFSSSRVPDAAQNNRGEQLPSVVVRPSFSRCRGVDAQVLGFRNRFSWRKLSFFPVDSLSVDSIEGQNQVSGKGFATTGPRIEAGNVVIHRRLYTPMPGRSVYSSYVNGLCCELELLIRASFGITRLICVSFGITRLIGVSFGVTRLIRVSFGITRLIRASFEIMRLMCKGTARGRPTRGKKDA